MSPADERAETREAYRELVGRLLGSPRATGGELAAAVAVVRAEPESDIAFRALCMVLEHALADPKLPIDDTQLLVPLLKDLARGLVRPRDLV